MRKLKTETKQEIQKNEALLRVLMPSARQKARSTKSCDATDKNTRQTNKENQ